MSTIIQGDELRELVGGKYVTKTIASTTNATQSMFTVTGLNIVKALIGEVVVAMDGTTTSINVVHNPTIGSVADVNAATVVTSDVIGTIYGYLGVAINTLLVSTGTAVPGTVYAPVTTQTAVFTAGVIGYKGTATDAGSVKWHLLYVPLSDGASIVAA